MYCQVWGLVWGRWSKKGTEWGKGIAGGGTAGAGEATDDGDSGEDVGCEEEEGLSLGCFLGFPWWVLHLFRHGFFRFGAAWGCNGWEEGACGWKIECRG